MIPIHFIAAYLCQQDAHIVQISLVVPQTRLIFFRTFNFGGARSIQPVNIVNDTLKYGKQRGSDVPIGTHVPFLRHVDEQTVITKKSGMLASVIKLSGIPFQTLDQEDINARLANRNTTVRSLGSSRFALYSTIIRRRIKSEIDGSFDIPFAEELDGRYMDRIRQKTLFVNEIYLTVIRRPMQGRLGTVEKILDWFKMTDGAGEARSEALQDLRDMVEKVAGDLKSYRAEVLAIADRNGTVYSEIAEFLAKVLAAGDERPMPLPRMSLDSYVGTGRIFFGKKIIEVHSHDGTSYLDQGLSGLHDARAVGRAVGLAA